MIKLCDAVASQVTDPRMRAGLDEIRAELTAPLRLAVVGRRDSGRSTLVDALLGRRLARPGEAETAAAAGPVTFAYAARERVELIGPDGAREVRALHPDGSLPDTDSGGAVAGLEVWLPLDALRALTLICPAPVGEARAHRGPAQAPEAFLVTLAADAVADPAELPRLLAAHLPDTRTSAVNTTVVLTKADLLRWPLARAKPALGARAAAATAFVGPLAAAANSGVIDERHIDIIRRLAELDAPARDQLLASPEDLLGPESSVATADRALVLDAIGLHGLRCGLDLAEANPAELTVIGLTRRLRELSGIEEIDRQIDGFQQRADALKAGAALARLEALSFRWPELAFLRDQVEVARFEPGMHVLDLTRAFERAVADDVELPSELLAGLDRLVTAPTPAERMGLADDASPADLERAALDSFQAWKMFENTGQSGPAARRVARVAARSFELLAKEAARPGD